MQSPHPETWRDIPGWVGYYQASNHGGIRSVPRVVEQRDGRRRRITGGIMTPRRADYPMVRLRRPGYSETKRVHSLVAAAFLGPRPAGLFTCHGNGNRYDNRIENLRYATQSENEQDKLAHGTHNNASKVSCPRGHDLAQPNLVAARYQQTGHRLCLACDRARSYIRRHPDLKPHLQKVSDNYHQTIVHTAAAA
ncbi:NUMOD4 motif-containing HNH endonuclease [Nocardia sp. NPDC050435]|uniref:NUMOD4 motif-containing HNH endonuclease n=1 Tax=Nocardia sp. NPDC050435 TaxID=3155040 RepID=UPI003404BF1F